MLTTSKLDMLSNKQNSTWDHPAWRSYGSSRASRYSTWQKKF